jgi:hypothetical protein
VLCGRVKCQFDPRHQPKQLRTGERLITPVANASWRTRSSYPVRRRFWFTMLSSSNYLLKTDPKLAAGASVQPVASIWNSRRLAPLIMRLSASYAAEREPRGLVQRHAGIAAISFFVLTAPEISTCMSDGSLGKPHTRPHPLVQCTPWPPPPPRCVPNCEDQRGSWVRTRAAQC